MTMVPDLLKDCFLLRLSYKHTCCWWQFCCLSRIVFVWRMLQLLPERLHLCLCCSKLQNRELRDHGGSRAGAVEDKPTVAGQHFTHPVTLSVIHSKANRTNQSETTVQHLLRLWALVIHSNPNLHTPSPADEDKDKDPDKGKDRDKKMCIYCSQCPWPCASHFGGLWLDRELCSNQRPMLCSAQPC